MTDRGFTSHLLPFDALDACSGQAFHLLLPAFSWGSTAREGAFLVGLQVAFTLRRRFEPEQGNFSWHAVGQSFQR